MARTPLADTAIGSDAPAAKPGEVTELGAARLQPRSRAPWWVTGDGLKGYKVPHEAVMERTGWSAVAVLVVCSCIASWSSTLVFAGAGLLQVAALAMALIGLARCWGCVTAPSWFTQGLLVGAAIVALGTTAAGAIISNPFYGTDEVAFSQYQAHLALSGINPFTASLAPSIMRYHVPVDYITHFLNGSAIEGATYPAGSFLFYMPALALGMHAQAAIIVDLVSWVVALLLLWTLVPRRVSWVAVIFVATTVYASFIIGGVTDSLYLPFLILAMWRWDKYGVRGAGFARWIGPVALGLAMSVKQTPWFFAPFLVIGVANEVRARGDRWLGVVGRYIAAAAATFLLLNLTWILDSPSKWFKACLIPLTASFVPLGQGLINITLANRLGGGNLAYFSYAGLAWVGMVLVLALCRHRFSKRVWPYLVIASFFFTPRSLGNYFMMMLPAALVGSLTVSPGEDDGILHSKAPWVFLPLAGITVAATVGFTVGALGTSAPLKLKILGVVTNGQEQLVTTAKVRVTNLTSHKVSPDFSAVTGGYLTNFWRTAQGQLVVSVPPHATRVVSLYAPDVSSMPSAVSPFQLVAYAERPSSVSSSESFLPKAESVQLVPASLDGLVPLGRGITFTAQLDDRFGEALHKAGVPIDLGQIVYAERGLLGGSASINDGPEGQSPAEVLTNREGQATFTVIGMQSSTNPTYFQAWIAPTGSVRAPHGYSDMVSVRFSPRA